MRRIFAPLALALVLLACPLGLRAESPRLRKLGIEVIPATQRNVTTAPTPVPATAPAPVAAPVPPEVPGAHYVPAAPDPALRKSTAARPTAAIAMDSCVTAACHPNVKNFKVLHGPVNVNACDACHTLSDAAKHTFTLTRDKKETCTFCHKIETTGMAVVHKPVTDGQCMACHDPHGGKTGKFIRSAAMNELCKQCHQDVIGSKKVVHGPAAAGACEACHLPHAAPNKKLLIAEGKALCMGCHKEMGEQLTKAKVVHKPVKQGECSQCHDPHASDFAMQVKAAPAELCTSCHEHDKIKKAALDAKHKHSVVTEGKACLNCHTPHGGTLGKLVKDEPVKVCMKCHEKGQTAEQGRTVLAVAEVLDKKQFRHGPVRDGSCGGCHDVHGSNVSRLLTKPYPDAFYQPFSPEKYDLCFTCHDKQLVTLPKTEGLTGFRNGEQNLHYLHVNRADKGRSCRACHEPHASKQPVHLRESVPFGQWALPINYKKTTTGGSCLPGCHQQFGYDREHPLDKPGVLPSETPATQPANGAVGVAAQP